MYRLSFAPKAPLLALGLLLAACVTTKAPEMTGSYRRAPGQIYSSAVLDKTRLAGRWQQVAGFGPEGACKPGGLEISPTGQAVWRLCLSGAEVKGNAPMQPVGPGRFDVGGQEWWVLWADGDYRTLVIGTPSGRFGFILNRGKISSDRLVAAKEILDWNGYDLSKLQVYAR